MNKTIKWLLTTIIVVIIIIIVVTKGEKPADKKIIKIGILAPLTGIVADYGEQMRKGIESASTTGIQFVYEDDKCDPKEAISAYKKLTDFEKVNYIIGPGCGSPQEAIAPLLASTSKIVAVPSAASRSLFAASGGNMFDMQYSLEDEAVAIADHLYSKGYTKVAIISYQNAFSKSETDSFKAHFKGTVTNDIVFAANATDVSTEIAKLKSSKFDAIFVVDISFYFANGLSKLHSYGINVPVYSPYAVELPAVRKLVEGVYYSFPADITDGQGGVNGISRQAAELFVNALKTCGDEPVCVKQFIQKDGFDSYGVKQRKIEIKQIKDGEPVIVQSVGDTQKKPDLI